MLTQQEKDWLVAHPVILLAPDPDFPPIEFLDEKGEYRGIAADYAALLEQKLGIRFTIVQLKNWSEVLEKAKNRGIDMFGAASESPQRTEYMSFTRPHIELPGAIIVRKSSDASLTLTDLRGMKVATVAGYIWQDLIANDYPDFALDLVPDIQTGLRKVSFGMVDAMVANLATATYYIEKEGITNLRVAGKTGYFGRYAFGVRNDWPELNRILEKGLATITPGERDAILKKWIRLERESLIRSKTFWITFLVGLTVLMIAVILAWNRSLRIQVNHRTKELDKELMRRQRMEVALKKSEQRFNLAMQGANDGLWDWHLDTNDIYYSPRWKGMLGYEDNEIPDNLDEWKKRIHKDDIEQVMAGIKAHLDGHTQQLEIIHRLRHKDERYRWILARGRAQRDGNGKPYRMVGTHVDITDRKEAEEKLRLAASVLENTPEGVMITDPERRLVAVNPAFLKTTGYSEFEVLGKTPRLLSSGRHDARFFADMWASLNELGQWQGEIWNRRKDGEIYPEWLNINVIRDKDGKITHYVGIFSDISTQEHIRKRLHRLAYYDALTDLPNRELFQDRLAVALMRAQREGQAVALLFLDLDRFKNINDTLGHTMGDRLLRVVGDQLKHCTRDSDTVARLGGDEFTIIVPDIAHPEDAARVAEKILQSFGKPFTLGNNDLFVTTSIGISLYPEDGEDSETLIKNGDTAMYWAKELGRNNYQFYEMKMSARSSERLALENDLRKALDREQLQVVYQPQVELSSGRIVGVEALVRWQHEDLGWISPDVFIPIAEETGLIMSIGEWVLRTAAAAIGTAWMDIGNPDLRMIVAVNLSGWQLHQKQLLDVVTEVLTETGPNYCRLELELTESVLMENIELSVEVLSKLNKMGVQLAIDDFGTGYSSLSYLKRFAIDKLKIDQSFVRDIPIDKNDAEIAASVIAMGHKLNLKVVAEGVETEEQLEFLRSQGCDEIQGYVFSPPVPADEIARLLAQNGRNRVYAS